MISLLRNLENALKDYPSLILVLTLLSSLQIWQFVAWAWSKLFIRRDEDDIQIEYFRFFGPSTVRLMELLSGDVELVEDSDYHLKVKINGYQTLMEKRAWQAYCAVSRNRQFSVPGVLLWKQFEGDKLAAKRLDYLSKSVSDVSIAQWLEDNYIDQSGDIEIPRVDAWEVEHRREDRLGFLFMSIRNNTDRAISMIRLSFDKAEASHKLPKVEVPGRWAFDELNNEFRKKGDPSSYLFKELEFGITEEYSIPNLRPGEELAFLLSVYRSDVEGFENGYLSDVYRLKCITSRIGLKTIEHLARPPLREKSVKDIVPYGWFRQ